MSDADSSGVASEQRQNRYSRSSVFAAPFLLALMAPLGEFGGAGARGEPRHLRLNAEAPRGAASQRRPRPAPNQRRRFPFNRIDSGANCTRLQPR